MASIQNRAKLHPLRGIIFLRELFANNPKIALLLVPLKPAPVLVRIELHWWAHQNRLCFLFDASSGLFGTWGPTIVWKKKKLVSALLRSAAVFLVVLLFYLFPSPKHRTELEMRTEESFPFVRLLQRWNRFHSYFSLLTVRFNTTLELALGPV